MLWPFSMLWHIYIYTHVLLSFLIRQLLHTKKRKEETIHHLRAVLGDALISCEIDVTGPEITACSQGSPYLPPATSEEMFSLELPNQHLNGSLASSPISVTLDNILSPSHTLIQILCEDHKGLIYDVMRTLKDYNVQVEVFTAKNLPFHLYKDQLLFPVWAFVGITSDLFFFKKKKNTDFRFRMDGSLQTQKGTLSWTCS